MRLAGTKNATKDAFQLFTGYLIFSTFIKLELENKVEKSIKNLRKIAQKDLGYPIPIKSDKSTKYNKVIMKLLKLIKFMKSMNP